MAVAGNYLDFILEFKSGLIYVQTLGLKAALGPEKKKKKRKRKKQTNTVFPCDKDQLSSRNVTKDLTASC